MPHSTEKHHSLPVIIRRYDSNALDFNQMDSQVFQETIDMLNAQQEKFYYIIDVSNIRINLEEMTKAGGLATHKDSPLSSNKIIETLIVVPNRLVEIATQGLRTATFGYLQVRPFRSVEEALAYVQRQTTRS